MAKKALLVVNPFSGKKKGVAEAAHIKTKLHEKKYNCKVFISTSVAELGSFIAKEVLPEYDLIGVVGGDGAMHEFLNAVLNKYETLSVPVALFPCGTGNAFNFDIGCSSVHETLQCIFNNSTSYIDIAEVNYTNQKLWSFNILGCGLVAEINELAEKMRWLGGSRYNVASVIKLLQNPKTKLEIETETGKQAGTFSFVLACNTRYTGKGMMMAPKAQLNDGRFDILLVQACSVWKLLNLFPKIFKGTHLGADVLSYIQSETLTVNSVPAGMTNIDGELKGNTPFSMKVYKNKVKVFVKA